MGKRIRQGTTWILIFSMTVLTAQSGAKLAIVADDLLRFDVVNFSAKSGTDLIVVLKNTGKIPALKHNWVLLKPGTNLTQFGNAAMNAAVTDYIPEGFKGTVIAHTALVGTGEEVSIRLKTPGKGVYSYICSFPGHYSLSRGTLTVTD